MYTTSEDRPHKCEVRRQKTFTELQCSMTCFQRAISKSQKDRDSSVRAYSAKSDIPHTQCRQRRNIAPSGWIIRIRVAATSQKASPGTSSSCECSTPLSSCVSPNDANLISVSPPLDISNILSSPSISYVLPVASNSYFLLSSSSSSAFRST